MGLKRAIADLIDTHPLLYLPAARLLTRSRYDLPGPHTELVVSGYPRSANSYAATAIAIAQQRPFEIASHLHAAAEVVAGVRRDLPTIVLIRAPQDAIRSLKAAEPGTDENRELRRWIRFYTRVEPLHAKFVISPFARTIGDLGSVLAETNARFGTAFKPVVDSAEARRRVSEGLQQSHARFGSHHLAAGPENREARLKGVALDFDPCLLACAAAIHARFLALCRWPATGPTA